MRKREGGGRQWYEMRGALGAANQNTNKKILKICMREMSPSIHLHHRNRNLFNIQANISSYYIITKSFYFPDMKLCTIE